MRDVAHWLAFLMLVGGLVDLHHGYPQAADVEFGWAAVAIVAIQLAKIGRTS